MVKNKGILKVCGISEESSGTRYHRVVLPLNALNGKKVTVSGEELVIETTILTFPPHQVLIPEEAFKNFDIVYNTWVPNNLPSEIGVWKQKYNTIYINDFDDVVPNHKHPYYTDELRRTSVAKILQTLLIADSIVVATPQISRYLIKHNPYIHISFNHLPFGEGQFTVRDYKIKEKGEKLNILIAGSGSHYYDYQELRPIINKICNDSQIQKEARFVLCGYSENPHSKALLSLFSQNKSMEVVTKETVLPEAYMEIYEDSDMVLAPLQDNFFNECKSSLALSSAACFNIPVIGSKLYRKKDINAYCACEKPVDYYTFIKFFVKNRDKIKEFGDKFGETNRNNSSFEKRIDGIKDLFATVLDEKFQKERYKEPENIKIFGITYEESQYTEYEKVFNWRRKVEEDSIFFEYMPIIEVLDTKTDNLKDSDFLGIFSWKFPQKTGFCKQVLCELIEENKDYDVINFTPYYRGLENNYLGFSDQYHPTFMIKFEKLCKHLNLTVKEPKSVIYANQFVMKKGLYSKFVNDIIKPAINYLKTEMKEEGMENAKYTAGLSPEDCEKYFGIPYYPMTTFLLERLASVYLENNPELKVKDIQ